MKEYLIVERIEAGLAVLELPNRQHLTLSLAVLPDSTREGDCLYLEQGKFYVDSQETGRRRQDNSKQLNDLFGKE